MKKIVVIAVLSLSVLFITGCTKAKNETTKKSEPAQQSAEKTAPVFKGTLSEAPVLDKDTIVLTFKQVKAVNDPDGIGKAFNTDGVILNADKKTVSMDHLSKGSEIEFTLKHPAILTNSLPPQVPGNSIQQITVIK